MDKSLVEIKLDDYKSLKTFLSNIPYSRKPWRPEDVTTSVDVNKIERRYYAAIHQLPFICSSRFSEEGWYTDAFDEYHNKDDDGVKIYGPQYWRTEYEGVWYLIDNQGYDYARYVTRLLNYSTKEFKDNFVTGYSPAILY